MNFFRTLVMMFLIPTMGMLSNDIDIKWKTCQANSFGLVKFSPSGRLIAAADSKTIKAWDINSGELKCLSVDLRAARYQCLEFSEDESIILAGYLLNKETCLKKINTKTNLVELDIKLSSGAVQSFIIAPKGKYAAVLYPDSTISIWNINEGKEAWHFDKTSEFWAMNIAFSPDGLTLAGTQANKIFLLNVETGKLIKSIEIDAGRMTRIKFGPDKDLMLIQNSGLMPVKVLNTVNGEVIYTLNKAGFRSLYIMTDIKSLAATTYDSIFVWNLESQEISFRAKKSYSQAEDFIGTGGKNLLAINGIYFDIWDMDSGAVFKRMSRYMPGRVSFSGKGDLVVNHESAQSTVVYNFAVTDAETGKYLNSYSISGNLHSLDFRPIPGTDYYLNINSPDTVWVNNLRDGTNYTFYDFDEEIFSATASPGLKYLALVTGNGASVSIYDCQGRIITDTLPDTYDAFFSKSNKYILFNNYGDGGAKITVRDIQSHENVFSYTEDEKFIKAFFSDNEKYIYVLEKDSALLKFDIETGALARQFTDVKYSGDINNLSLEVTPDDKYLILKLDSNSLQIYNLETESVAYAYDFHGLNVSSFALSPDYNSIAALYEDNSLVMWHIKAGPNGIYLSPQFENSTIKCYPNPAADLVHIDLPGGFESNCRVEILDVNGSLCKTITDANIDSARNTLTISTSGLASGIYLIRVRSGKGVSFSPVVIGR